MTGSCSALMTSPRLGRAVRRARCALGRAWFFSWGELSDTTPCVDGDRTAVTGRLDECLAGPLHTALRGAQCDAEIFGDGAHRAALHVGPAQELRQIVRQCVEERLHAG